jgi:hypothetical protein
MVRKLVGLGRNVRDRVVSPVSLTVIFAALAGICLWQGLRPDPVAVRGNIASDSSQATPSTPKYRTQKIRNITLGTWVLADNPEVDPKPNRDDIEPSQWQRLVLYMEKESGDRLDIELLRPLAWIDLTGASAGKTIDLEVPEMHVQGPAYVQFVGPCPDLRPRPSRRHHLVTGTFAHSAANIIELHVKGLSEPIRCTENHPFWSEDRQEFVQAGSLQRDERLLTAHGESQCVERVIACEDSLPVFNVEVRNQHTYFVSNLGLLAHNAGGVYSKTVSPRRFWESADGIRLFKKARAYRARFPGTKAAKQYRNFVAADVIVDGQRKTVYIKNIPEDSILAARKAPLHSEGRLIVWAKKMRKRGHDVKVERVFTDRIPSGDDWENCAGKLADEFGVDLDVYFHVFGGRL